MSGCHIKGRKEGREGGREGGRALTALNEGPSNDPSAITGKAKVDVTVLALRADVVNGRVNGAEHRGGTNAEASAGELREGGREGEEGR